MDDPSLREQGVQALQEGDLDKAVDLLARAVMADDADSEAKALLGVAYSQKGLHAQARRALQTAVEIEPQNANFRFNMGVVLERAGDMQGAVMAYRDALQINKDHPQARARLQALGPQAQALLANAPKAAEPVGVPTYSPEQPPSGPISGLPPVGPLAGGQTVGMAPPPSTYNAPPVAGSPAAGHGPMAPAAMGGGLNAPQGPPGTVQCGRCHQFTRPGLSCEWCSAPLGASRPASPTPAAGGYSPGLPGMYAAKPHRGGLILALGIVGLLLCGFAGIAAWIMGNRDLAEMDAGVMDASGRGMTQAGRVIGIITVVLNVLSLIWAIIVFMSVLSAARGG